MTKCKNAPNEKEKEMKIKEKILFQLNAIFFW